MKPRGPGNPKGSAAYAGLGIGILGAAIDLGSGLSLLQAEPSGAMGFGADASALGLFTLGLAALTCGVLMVLPRMAASARTTGVVMELLGVAMAVISYWVPMTNPLLSYAMLGVGGAMILDGAMAQRRAGGWEASGPRVG